MCTAGWKQSNSSLYYRLPEMANIHLACTTELCAQTTLSSYIVCAVVGKAHASTGHEGPDGEMYSSTLP